MYMALYGSHYIYGGSLAACQNGSNGPKEAWTKKNTFQKVQKEKTKICEMVDVTKNIKVSQIFLLQIEGTYISMKML